jgi:hypothetical protein
MRADEELKNFQKHHPEAITHKRTLQTTTGESFPTTLMSNNVSDVSSPEQSTKPEGVDASGSVAESLRNDSTST